MNKRQRKKLGFRPRPFRKDRKLYLKRIAVAKHGVEQAIDQAMLQMTLQECRDHDIRKVELAAEMAVRDILPFSSPWGDEMTILRITKQLPGTVHKINLNFMVDKYERH